MIHELVRPFLLRNLGIQFQIRTDVKFQSTGREQTEANGVGTRGLLRIQGLSVSKQLNNFRILWTV